MCSTQSEQIDQIAAALAEAQSELEPAGKNAQAPVGKEGGQKVRKYADMAAVFEVLKKVLPKNGLAITQSILPNNDGKAHVRTALLHKSGQWIASECIMPADRQGGIQGLGSAISYARRYSLAALVGVVSDDDDDGQAAQGSGQGHQRPPQQSSQNTTSQQRQQPPQNNTQTRPPQGQQSSHGERPPAQQEPQPPDQHINLNDAMWEFMQCNDLPTLNATAKRLQVRKDNPQYEAIHAAYAARLDDLKGQGANPDGSAPRAITPAQRTAIMAYYGKRGMTSDDKRDARLADLSSFCGRAIASVNDLTLDEASDYIEAINADRPQEAA